MDLICYLHPGWEPLIRPAEAVRDWMTATPDSFAYRCLPLNIANAHGWEILSPCTFEARWTGGIGTGQVDILEPGAGQVLVDEISHLCSLPRPRGAEPGRVRCRPWGA